MKRFDVKFQVCFVFCSSLLKSARVNDREKEFVRVVEGTRQARKTKTEEEGARSSRRIKKSIIEIVYGWSKQQRTKRFFNERFLSFFIKKEKKIVILS